MSSGLVVIEPSSPGTIAPIPPVPQPGPLIQVVQAAKPGLQALIDDTTATATSTYSSQKVQSIVAAATAPDDYLSIYQLARGS